VGECVVGDELEAFIEDESSLTGRNQIDAVAAAMVNPDILLHAYRLICTASAMAETYESNRSVCKYVHSVSRGHEAVQIAAAFHLLPIDYVSPYYRDESLLLGLGFSPYQLMLQLLAKGEDIFSGGREYYSHPNYRVLTDPESFHQSSATGMQAIPSTGLAQGMAYLEKLRSSSGVNGANGPAPLVLLFHGRCQHYRRRNKRGVSIAVLKKLPIIYLVQDNGWGISATSDEIRRMDAFEYASGFKEWGDSELMELILKRVTRGSMLYLTMSARNRSPYLVQAKVPLLGHHTSGVRKDFYRSKGRPG